MHFMDAQRAMDHIGRGLIAGFIATLALSVLVDPIAAMIRAASPGSSVLSWMFHVFAGTLMWGASFACVHDLIGGPSWLRGIIFGCAIWLAATAILLSTRMFGAQPSFA